MSGFHAFLQLSFSDEKLEMFCVVHKCLLLAHPVKWVEKFWKTVKVSEGLSRISGRILMTLVQVWSVSFRSYRFLGGIDKPRLESDLVRDSSSENIICRSKHDQIHVRFIAFWSPAGIYCSGVHWHVGELFVFHFLVSNHLIIRGYNHEMQEFVT